MRKLPSPLTTALAALAVSGPSAVFAEEPTKAAEADAAPPQKEMACRACHGIGGNKPLTPSYPILAGKDKEYLVNSLNAYKSGERTGGLAAVMTGQAKMLSDEDIDALAEYYSKQQP